MKIFLSLLLALNTINANAAKVLFFGDSHSVATVGPFGIKMNQLIRSLPGAKVITHARCGSVMGSWYQNWKTSCGYFDQNAEGETQPHLIPATAEKKAYWPLSATTPKIISIIDQFKPDLIVVEMGGNYTHANDPEKSARTEIKKFIEDVKTRKIDCVWIGPPARRKNMDKMPALLTAIRETVEGTCEFVDSTTMTSYPGTGGDGTHFSFKTKTFNGIKTATEWAEKAFVTVKAHFDKISSDK